MDEDAKRAREEHQARSVESARKALEAIRKARREFAEDGAVAVVTKQLTPEANPSRFRRSTLHNALQPFTQLGNQPCDTPQT